MVSYSLVNLDKMNRILTTNIDNIEDSILILMIQMKIMEHRTEIMLLSLVEE
jgi:hypothetical protein